MRPNISFTTSLFIPAEKHSMVDRALASGVTHPFHEYQPSIFFKIWQCSLVLDEANNIIGIHQEGTMGRDYAEQLFTIIAQYADHGGYVEVTPETGSGQGVFRWYFENGKLVTRKPTVSL